LGSLIADSPYFRLLAPVKLSVVCFTLSKPLHELDEATTRFLEILAERGVAFMTPTVYLHTPAIRAALVSWRTTEQDVRRVWEEMEQIAQSLKPKAESKEKPLLDKLLGFLL
jgi:glutamate/tyrosine decarboxylase-like PLP-dependent enzyme